MFSKVSKSNTQKQYWDVHKAKSISWIIYRNTYLHMSSFLSPTLIENTIQRVILNCKKTILIDRGGMRKYPDVEFYCRGYVEDILI